MIIIRNSFSNDVLKLSEIDIKELQQGKVLSIAGLTIKHVVEHIETSESDPNHSEK